LPSQSDFGTKKQKTFELQMITSHSFESDLYLNLKYLMDVAIVLSDVVLLHLLALNPYFPLCTVEAKEYFFYMYTRVSVTQIS